MYICMYVCMYACTYVCMHVCMYICMYVCMYACTYVCMHVYMYIMYVCMYACTYVCMYACMHVQTTACIIVTFIEVFSFTTTICLAPEIFHSTCLMFVDLGRHNLIFFLCPLSHPCVRTSMSWCWRTSSSLSL